MNTEEADRLITRVRALSNSGNDRRVVEECGRLLASHSADLHIRFAVAGFLIDSGGALRDLRVVDDGKAILEQLLHQDTLSAEPLLTTGKYNLSNGCYVRFELLRSQGKPEQALAELRHSKVLLEDVLLNQEQLDVGLRSRVMSNYGNVLDHLGRTVEAVDWYYDAARSRSDQAVAMANCGIAVRKLVGVSGRHRAKNIYEAWTLLSRSCEMKREVERYAGHAAYEYFTAQLENLAEAIETSIPGGVGTLRKYGAHRVEKHGSPKATAWLAAINTDRLLLTLNQHPINATSECIDDLFFDSLVTPRGEKGVKRFRDLAHSLNMLKEDFATARYLYYHSIDAQQDLAEHGKITKYADTFDDSAFQMQYGVLKASFRIAADCLEKVAVLIDEYFQLHHKGDAPNINNVWFNAKDRKRGLHPVIERGLRANPFLRALKELQEDWFLETFPGPLKAIRDTATHLKLLIYQHALHDPSSQHNDWNTEDAFPKYTRYLLRLVKAAIIYVVCAVNFEESKYADEGSLAGPLEFKLR